MRNLILYGPLPETEVAGGYDRMNSIILKELGGNKGFNIIGMPIKKVKLRGYSKKILYPFIFLYSTIRDLYRLNENIKNNSIELIHITALYGVFIVREAIMIWFAKKKILV